MKKGLLILLAGLFFFGCSRELSKSAGIPQDREENRVKVYSLKDFLDSVYVFKLQGGENQLCVAANLIGKEFLIEATVENWVVRPDDRNEKDDNFSVELFHRNGLRFYNKQKTKLYKVDDFSIVAPPSGFRISAKNVKEDKYDDLNYWQRELITAFLDGKPKENVRITGYIKGWSDSTDINCSYFHYIEFEFEVLKVEVR